MVDLQTVCCMCGDIGFPEKLFRCNKCRHRFQHSYCSNFYGELGEIEMCDWCQSEVKNGSAHGGSNSKNRTVVASEKMKHHHHDRNENCSSSKGKSSIPSPRHATRRYKLLKDVMC